MIDRMQNSAVSSTWKPVYPRDLPILWQMRSGLPFMGVCLLTPLLFLLGILIFVPGRIGDSLAEMGMGSLIVFIVFVGGTWFAVFRNLAIGVLLLP